MVRRHRCDEKCVCPVDGKGLIYAPASGEHCCPDIDCKYGHGYESVLVEDWYDTLLVRSRKHEAQRRELLARLQKPLDLEGWTG